MAMGWHVAKQVDQVDQDDVQAARLAEAPRRAAIMRGHIAVMVGAPDVHDQIEAAFELVVVVGDVGREIGGCRRWICAVRGPCRRPARWT